MTRYDAAYLEADEPVKMDLWLWLIPLILSGLGILMVTSTTSNFVYDVSGTPFTMGIRQIRSLGLGFAFMLFAIFLPTHFWRGLATVMWVTALLMLVATLIPGVGSSGGGASRWIRLGGLSIQPSEIMILAVVLEMGKLFEKHSDDPQKCFYTVIMLIVITAVPLLMQPDLGSTIFLTLICMGMFVERFGWRLPLTIGIIGVGALLLLVLLEPYRMRRWNAFRDPHADPLDAGFQTIQGLIAFANGGVWGAGLGHGFQKLQYLPAAYTDFIYAAMGEELGLLGTLGVLTLMAVWMLRCRSLYKRAPRGFEASVVWGVTLTIALPFYINVAGVTNLIPLTGMPLPFVSYGGSSLIMSWVRLGILLRMQRDAAKGLPA
ncbi:MAG: FtsW/RodA/SpoVE family cell cycle protein [Synergistaceae bacterium]|jgi:cell division protein FtsW|nr:FtsW/RodA/SpoVE family cell cycle protein [Synergistaceae bacterium]